jgi:hypothetical protein
LTAFELVSATLNLDTNRFPIFQEPAILFLLGFKQAKQHFFDIAGAGCLELFLDPGLEIGITDFEMHC